MHDPTANRYRRISLTLGLSALTSGFLLMAAQPSAAPQGAMADADARAILNSLVGQWEVSGSSVQPDGSVSEQLSGVAHWSWAMGDNFVSGEMSLNNGRAVMGAAESFGYSPQTGLFSMSEMTSIDRSMFMSTGSFDPSTRSVTFNTINPLETPQGAVRSVQTKITFQDTSSLTMEVGFFEAGAIDGTLQLAFKRSADATATQGAAAGAQGTTSGAQGTTSGAQGSATATGAPTMSVAQMQQALQSMAAQKAAMQGQMNSLHSQVSQMSSQFHDAMLND